MNDEGKRIMEEWADRERAEYFAHCQIRDIDGRPLTMDEIRELAKPDPPAVTVPLPVLEEALEQIEHILELAAHADNSSGEYADMCVGCVEAGDPLNWSDEGHCQKCRVLDAKRRVRALRDALK